MVYELMHKDTPVLSFSLDKATASIIGIDQLFHPEHLPVGIPFRKTQVDRAALNSWWLGRAIPASRQGLSEALSKLRIPTQNALLEKCLGRSLSDPYWIRPAGSIRSWSAVNFFENGFSDDVGNILFGGDSDGKAIDLASPDNTCDGWLRKKWIILDGKRRLIKGGSGTAQQEPYNEVFASLLMRRLGIPHVNYTLTYLEDRPYSVCENFITPDTELVSAWYIMQTRKKENHHSVYQHFLRCCEALGIPDVQGFIDRMLVADYLLLNEDRHQNNFGAIRDVNTLRWVGMAPLYDSGTSLWFDKPTAWIRAGAARTECKPFKTSHEAQIKLVDRFDWIDWKALDGIEYEFRAIAAESPFVDEPRQNAICAAFQKRVEMLRIHADSAASRSCGTAHDVPQDIAYSGKQE